jgi:hypothetical protein
MIFVPSRRNSLTGKQLGNLGTMAELGILLASRAEPLNYGQGA